MGGAGTGGAGTFGAGTGGAGGYPVFRPGYPLVLPLSALLFDLKTRSFVQNADGTLAHIHPIDQAVAFLVYFQQGSVPSDPTLGNRIQKRVERASPRVIPSIVNDEITRALAPLTANNDIKLLSIVVDVATRGRVLYAVSYVNLRDPSKALKKMPTTIGFASLQAAA
jgi:hypothetical protein